MAKRKRRKLYREVGVSFYLKSQKGVTPRPYKKKSRVIVETMLISENKWSQGICLEVVYQAKVSNAGTFYGKDSLLYALSIWTDKDLVEYCTTGEWL